MLKKLFKKINKKIGMKYYSRAFIKKATTITYKMFTEKISVYFTYK